MGLFNLFRKNDENEQKLHDKISMLEADIARKDKEISTLVDENTALRVGDTKDSKLEGGLDKSQETSYQKQIEIFNKNLKDVRDENTALKNILGQYNIKFTREKHYYKVDIYKFFTSTKFAEITQYLSDNGIKYIQDITEEFVAQIPEELKNLEDAKEKLKNFWTREFIEWDIITYMNKGDRISRIYNKSRKFSNLLAEEKIEFMEDMLDYDFDKLLIKGFDEAKVEEFKTIRDTFYAEERVSYN